MSITAEDKFCYSPLSDASTHIRLLHVSRASAEGELNAFQMTEHSMNNLPRYAAISYVWGTSTDRYRMVIDGSWMEVNPNASMALAQACHYNREALEDDEDPVYFWMDTLCINQQDTSEKNLQVEMMAEIYGRAKVVYSCVGPHEDSSEMLIEVFNALTEVEPQAQDDQNGDQQDTQQDDHSTAEVQWLLSRDEEYLWDICGALARFAHRPYWSRMWIVQELYMGEDCEVMCGNDDFFLSDLESLQDAIDNLLDCELSPDTRFRVEAECAHISRGFMWDAIVKGSKDHTTSFGSLVERMGTYKCYDARDRIYALNSMIRWGDGQGRLRPDYTLSCFDVLVQAVGLVQLAVDDFNGRFYDSLFQRVQFGVLEALRVDATNDRMQSEVAERRRGDPSAERQAQGVAKSPILRECSFAFAIISEEPREKLTVAFRKVGYTKSKEATELLQHLDRVERDNAAFGGLFEGRRPQRLYIGTAVAGLVCNGAQEDDYLYPWITKDFGDVGQVYIVLRQHRSTNACTTRLSSSLSMKLSPTSRPLPQLPIGKGAHRYTGALRQLCRCLS